MTSPADRIPGDPSNLDSAEVTSNETPESDTVDVPSENIEFERIEQGLPKRRKGLSLNWVILIVLITASGSWIIWERYLKGPDPDKVPLIKAPDGPYKVKPSTPGGMPIPNRDKTVYDTFGKNTMQTATETLLPKPEQPLPAPEPKISVLEKQKPILSPPPSIQVEKLLNSSQSSPKRPINKFEANGELGEIRTPNVPSVLPSKSRSLNKINTGKSENFKISRIPSINSPTDPITENNDTNLKKFTPASSSIPFSKSSFQIQLAAVRAEGAAKTEWLRLKTRHKELLGSLSINVVKADLGSKGIYYRLRAGPLKDKGSAKKLCAELSRVRVNCLVVRPGK